MKNHRSLLFLALVTGTAGLAAFGLANTEFAARFPLEAFLSATVSLALVRFAFSDYARRPKALSVPAAILRPTPGRSRPEFSRHRIAA